MIARAIDNPARVSLTFDDGLRCQFERAVPILDKYDLPATFFLVANTDPIHTDGHSHPDWRKTNWNDQISSSLPACVSRDMKLVLTAFTTDIHS